MLLLVAVAVFFLMALSFDGTVALLFLTLALVCQLFLLVDAFRRKPTFVKVSSYLAILFAVATNMSRNLKMLQMAEYCGIITFVAGACVVFYVMYYMHKYINSNAEARLKKEDEKNA